MKTGKGSLKAKSGRLIAEGVLEFKQAVSARLNPKGGSVGAPYRWSERGALKPEKQ